MNFKFSISCVFRALRCGWASIVLALFGFVFFSPAATAAMQKAGELITNKATVEYFTSDKLPRRAESKDVSIKVLQVYGFMLDTYSQGLTNVGQSGSGKAGTDVSVTHTLRNTGNGDDEFSINIAPDPAARFSKVEVRVDGQKILCVPGASGACTFNKTVTNEATLSFDVVYTLTSDAPATVMAATVTASPVLATPSASPKAYLASNLMVAVKDKVTVLSSAFTLDKSIDGSQTTAPDGAPWPKGPSIGPKSSAGAKCDTTWHTGLQSSDGCQYTVFTLKFQNTGTVPGNFAVKDALRSGFTYVAGSSVWKRPGGLARLTDVPSGNSSVPDYFVSGNTITAVATAVPVGEIQYISFMVLVNNTARAGSTDDTSNTASFNAGDARTSTAANPGELSNSSNSVTYFVVSYGLALGSAASTASTAPDKKQGVPNEDASDIATVPFFSANGTADFKFTVFNTGNTDTYVSLEVDTGSSTFPPNTSFTFYAADGQTLLKPVSGSAKRYAIDVPVAKGLSSAITVRASLNDAATTMSGLQGVSSKVIFIARSLQNDAVSDTAQGVVTNLNDPVTVKLTVDKQQAKDVNCTGNVALSEFAGFTVVPSLKPGACIVYRITVTNATGANVTDVTIKDDIPPYTSLAGATQPSPSDKCSSGASPKMSGTPVVFGQEGGKLTCGSAANTLLQGGTLTMSFAVRINDK